MRDALYGDTGFTAVVWDGTHAISEVCLCFLKSLRHCIVHTLKLTSERVTLGRFSGEKKPSIAPSGHVGSLPSASPTADRTQTITLFYSAGGESAVTFGPRLPRPSHFSATGRPWPRQERAPQAGGPGHKAPSALRCSECSAGPLVSHLRKDHHPPSRAGRGAHRAPLSSPRTAASRPPQDPCAHSTMGLYDEHRPFHASPKLIELLPIGNREHPDDSALEEKAGRRFAP